MSGQARAEAGRAMAGASRGSIAEAATGSRGTARNSPGGSGAQGTESARGNSFSGNVAGTGASGSLSPSSASGTGNTGNTMLTNGARSVAGRGMAGATRQALAQAATGDFGSTRVRPMVSPRMVSVRGANRGSAVAGSGLNGGFAPQASTNLAAEASVPGNGPGNGGGTDLASAGSVSSPRASTGRLGGGALATDQAMTQISSQSMAKPVSMRTPRNRPRMSYRSQTESPDTSASPIEDVATHQQNPGTQAFAPSVEVVRQTLPPVEEVTPTRIPSQEFTNPENLTTPVRQPTTRPRETPVNTLPTQATNPAEPQPQSDLEAFRTQGFQTDQQGQGKNFVFIIDRSESMSQDSRLAAAKEALASTLEKMDADENYYIYFFSDETVAMQGGRLMAATSGNISQTGRWVNTMSPKGLTNPRDALKDAFQKLNPSTVWLLSDGKFTSVKRLRSGNKVRLVGLPSVLRVIRGLNRENRVRINTIGFGAEEGEVDASLKTIAEENGGSYSFIHSNE